MKIQAQEETENGTEAVNETTNEGHVADKWDLEENMNYGMQSDNQHMRTSQCYHFMILIWT
jgi:hypothetical protein